MSAVTGRRRPRWSLRARLVVSSVTLLAIVAALIGTVATLALRNLLWQQVEQQVAVMAGRVGGEGRPQPGPGTGAGPRAGTGASGGSGTDPGTGTDTARLVDQWRFVTGPGNPPGALGATLDASGRVTKAVLTIQPTTSEPDLLPVEELGAAQRGALDALPAGDGTYTAELPGRGDFLVRRATAPDGAVLLVGLPTRAVTDTVGRLVAVEVCLTLAGLVAAWLAGSALTCLNLRPLRRVAATATRVSELPLHSGEPALHERVPDTEADPRTEVGQVGAALNRMLGHISSALTARQQSETRVRRFVADASHELRTPLAAIRGYAELTRRGREEVGPDTRHALDRIESAAGRMTLLVEDLLLLARLDAGRPLELTGTDLVPLVVEAVSDARAAGPDHGWLLEIPDTEAHVLGDPQRLHQVLANLLANARTHTPPGTTVTTRVRPEPADGTVRVEIEDDGPGIPPALLPHVFERFARGDASRSRQAGSTGLGLAIVHAVVTAHGGEVHVESEPGRTVLRVRLPATP